MAIRLPARPASPDGSVFAESCAAARFERAAAGLAIALAVARPLYPSEDAYAGSGLVFVGLWGFAALLWACAQVARNELRLVFGLSDGLALVLLATVIVSVFWADTPRPAINMACEWAGLVVSYLVTRQLFRVTAARRSLAAALLALAVCLAIDGLYQAFWGLEPDRARYVRDPAGVLADLGIMPGTPQQQAFEDRLRSHEPFATFALANSLAGFLVAWLPLMLGCVAATWLTNLAAGPVKAAPARRAGYTGTIVTLFSVAAALVSLACLILTQSRTAYVAFLVELFLLAALFGPRLMSELRRRAATKWLWGSLGLTALCIGAMVVLAVARGKIDEKLFTQATKSFGYRWQYWQSTLGLIHEMPWTGTGPGNFRGHYLRYKLADSSEEIADPHNMILEIAATSGVPAAVAFLCFLGVSAWKLVRQPNREEPPNPPAPIWTLWVPGLVGWTLAGLFSSSDPAAFVLLFPIWVGLAAVFARGFEGEAGQPRVFAAAVLGLAIHLLGAGGIAMPGVAQSLWLLIALGLNATEFGYEWRVVGGRKLVLWLFIGVAMAELWFGVEVLQPVTASQAALSRGLRLFRDGSRPAAEGQVSAAILQDPLWAEPWMELSRIQYQRWAGSRGELADGQFDAAIASLDEAVQRAPSSLEPHRLRAELLEARARREDHKGYWILASEAYGEAVAIYPTSARLRAKRAEALWEADRRDEAAAEMGEALRLDAATPHLDKKLDSADRERFQRRLRDDTKE